MIPVDFTLAAKPILQPQIICSVWTSTDYYFAFSVPLIQHCQRWNHFFIRDAYEGRNDAKQDESQNAL
jgi:hypothetical protein